MRVDAAMSLTEVAHMLRTSSSSLSKPRKHTGFRGVRWKKVPKMWQGLVTTVAPFKVSQTCNGIPTSLTEYKIKDFVNSVLSQDPHFPATMGIFCGACRLGVPTSSF